MQVAASPRQRRCGAKRTSPAGKRIPCQRLNRPAGPAFTDAGRRAGSSWCKSGPETATGTRRCPSASIVADPDGAVMWDDGRPGAVVMQRRPCQRCGLRARRTTHVEQSPRRLLRPRPASRIIGADEWKEPAEGAEHLVVREGALPDVLPVQQVLAIAQVFEHFDVPAVDSTPL